MKLQIDLVRKSFIYFISIFACWMFLSQKIEAQITSETNFTQEEMVSLLEDVIQRQEDYIGLRSKGFDEIDMVSRNTKFELDQDMADLSTKLQNIKTQLELIKVGSSDEPSLSSIQKSLSDFNQDLKEVNRNHQEIIKDDIYKQYLAPYSQTTALVYKLFDKNKEMFEKEELEKISDFIDETDVLAQKLEDKYSEAVWTRLEEKIFELRDFLKTVSKSLQEKSQ